MTNIIKRTFGSVRIAYLIRSYLIALVFSLMVIFAASHTEPGPSKNSLLVAMILLSLLNSILFPFSKILWEGLRNFLIGNNEIWSPVPVIVLQKLFVNSGLWCFSIFIAPFGILYLWFSNRDLDSAIEESA
ncbi:hypothetical protein CQ054_21530 [Ochrobactrum sp. MYb29]|nr:hypothetical protein CQ054_21530 [Ochrobactrum sp. MYb29]